MRLSQNLSLRDWQIKAFESWEESNYKGLISVVTGGGKTIFALYCLSYLFEKKIITQCLIVVPTKTLQDQWASNILSFTDVKKIDISFSNKTLKKVNILTNISSQRINPDLVGTSSCMVLDECHRYGTFNNQSFLSLDCISKIGLTATLERKYDDGIERFIKPNVGELIYEYGIKNALKDNVVENYLMVNLRTHLNDQENNEYEQLSVKIRRLYSMIQNINFDKSSIKKQIERLLIKRSRVVNNSHQRVSVAAKLILDNIERKKIVFSESINQAEEIRNLCKMMGLDTTIYHSKLGRDNRISNLVAFQSNYYHTLIGCKSLDEGFDVPDIDFGIIVSQTSTQRQRIQRLGRTIRKYPDKVKPVIYTLYSTDNEYQFLYNEMVENPHIEVNWIEVK